VKWLLDTNVLSENVRVRPDQTVMDWFERLILEDAALSIVTLAELQNGVFSSPSEKRRSELTDWLERSVMPSFGSRILQLTGEILVDWLRLSRKLSKRRITRTAPDLLIASTARVHNLIVVSRNARDFADTGVIVYDPWANTTHRMDDP
jgi:toxin FitB